jgi:ankyrin repeat protein
MLQDNDVLCEAIRSGDGVKVRDFLQRVDSKMLRIYHQDDLPLTEAVLTGKVNIVQILLDFEFNLNASCYLGGTSPLELAIESRQSLDFIRFLLKSGADPNFGGCATTPLICTISRQDFQILNLLLEAGACLNTRAEEGWSPLMEASFIGCLDTIKLLTKLGANLNAKTNDGETALDIAKRMNHVACYSFLFLLQQQTGKFVD